jgi:DNA-binding Lrp family transcriptional regulator
MGGLMARQSTTVAQALIGLDGVQLAEDLAGPSDVTASLQAPSLDKLGRLIIFRIQVVDGVTRTLTCIVLHASGATPQPATSQFGELE